MAKKINGSGSDLLLLAAIGIGGYFLYNKFFGASDQTIVDEAGLGANNPFSYQFQPFIDFFNNNEPIITQTTGATNIWPFGSTTTATTTTPTIDQYFKYLKETNPTVSTYGFLNTVDLSSRAEKLYNSINVNPLNPLSVSDQSSAMSALAGLTNQMQIAFIANYIYYNYGQDLLSFLNGSVFKPGLSSANLDLLINTVNNLPVNP